MDEKYLDNSYTFSLFNEKELESQKYIHEINKIVEKYNILENENELIGPTDKSFLYLLDYIFALNKKNQTIPKDLEDIFLNNLFLKEQINFYLIKTLDNLSKNNPSFFFKELNLIFSALSIGTNEKILDFNFNCNFESVSKLFRFYESSLKNLFESNSKLFQLTFDSFTILLNTFIQLSKINSIDIVKTKYISSILDLVTETISITKFNILLSKEQLRILGKIQGKYLFYFSHLDDIHTSTQGTKSIEKCFLCFQKQTLGYTLYQENTSHSDDITLDEFLVHKGLSSSLILGLINNLEKSLFKEDFFNTDFFKRILTLYYKTFFNEENIIKKKKNIQEFKKDLLNSLFYNYSISFNFTKIIDYHSIINDFILSEKHFNHKNLGSIYRLLHFAKDIETFKYFNIVEILSDSKATNNEYDEFYKLCIFDLLINKPLNEKYSNQKIKVFNKILLYLNENEIPYQLKSIYNKLLTDLSKYNLSAESSQSKEKNSNDNIQKIILSYTSDDDYEINY